jgi:hypothetical protein
LVVKQQADDPKSSRFQTKAGTDASAARLPSWTISESAAASSSCFCSRWRRGSLIHETL